jgi:hypothetical protein
MRTALVVAEQPVLGDVLDLLNRLEQVRIEHFRAVGSVETFDVGVLVRLTRFDESQRNPWPQPTL